VNPDPTDRPGETVSNRRRTTGRTAKTVLWAVTAAAITTLAILAWLLIKEGI